MAQCSFRKRIHAAACENQSDETTGPRRPSGRPPLAVRSAKPLFHVHRGGATRHGRGGAGDGRGSASLRTANDRPGPAHLRSRSDRFRTTHARPSTGRDPPPELPGGARSLLCPQLQPARSSASDRPSPRARHRLPPTGGPTGRFHPGRSAHRPRIGGRAVPQAERGAGLQQTPQGTGRSLRKGAGRSRSEAGQCGSGAGRPGLDLPRRRGTPRVTGGIRRVARPR